jgi:hypothetical protein
MQPYIFPYLGYYQLVQMADTFVFLDDVSFIKGGWINRNRILVNGQEFLFTVPLQNASPNRMILEHRVMNSSVREKLLRTIDQAYRRAPFHSETMVEVESILASESDNIAELARLSVIRLSSHLNVTTNFVESSTCYGNRSLKGQTRIIDICRREQASEYVNLPGGRALYSSETFKEAGLDLCFLESDLPEYSQGLETHKPKLSIIDALMHGGRSGVREMLNECKLVR